jgi:hypothetical protein
VRHSDAEGFNPLMVSQKTIQDLSYPLEGGEVYDVFKTSRKYDRRHKAREYYVSPNVTLEGGDLELWRSSTS